MKDPTIQIRKGENIPFEMGLTKLIKELSVLNLLDYPLDETTKLYLNGEEVEKPSEMEEGE